MKRQADGKIPRSLMKDERLRLKTFTQYPQSAEKSALTLARDGFFHTSNGRDDSVVCYFCGAFKRDWCVEDDVHTVHQLLCPECPMVTGNYCNNVPIDADAHSRHMLLLHPGPSIQQFSTGSIVDSTSRLQFTLQNLSIQYSNTSPSEIGPPIHEPHPDPSIQQFSTGSIIDSTSRPQSTLPNVSIQYSNTRPNGLGPPIPEPNTQQSHTPAEGSTIDTSPRLQTARPPVREPHHNNTIIQNTDDSNVVSHTQISYLSNAMQNLRCEDLGIVTSRPKRFELAIFSRRLETFQNWPQDHHQRKEDLAETGFFYAGYGDCVRCFYCGGSLRNWDKEDDIRVEHARWFPKCGFIRQKMGRDFVDTVQKLHNCDDSNTISFKMALEAMKNTDVSNFETDHNPLSEDPAVQIVCEMGFGKTDVLQAAEKLRSSGNELSATALFDVLCDMGKYDEDLHFENCSETPGEAQSASGTAIALEQLEEENRQIRHQFTCKICHDKLVSMTFLPCGHFVCCMECASSVPVCPICRAEIQGTVPTYLFN